MFRHSTAAVFAILISISFVPRISAASVQVSDANLLSGLAANPANIGISTYDNDGGASSIYGPGGADYGPQNATNGLGGGPGKDFVFAIGDPDERIAVTGFNSALSDIRVWTATDLAPSVISIYSSTSSTTSIIAAGYGAAIASTTSPAWIAGTGASAGLEYADFKVATPAGTQSLLFDFGATNSGNPQYAGFVRVAELQAYPTPEPSSIVLWGLGVAASLFAYRRRKA